MALNVLQFEVPDQHLLVFFQYSLLWHQSPKNRIRHSEKVLKCRLWGEGHPENKLFMYKIKYLKNNMSNQFKRIYSIYTTEKFFGWVYLVQIEKVFKK